LEVIIGGFGLGLQVCGEHGLWACVMVEAMV
jgi:hypothetical protein